MRKIIDSMNKYRSSYSTSSFHLSERGIILIVFPVVLILVLLIIGLAIDSARLYHTQLDAQTAADAAVLSAIGARAGERDQQFIPDRDNWESTRSYIHNRAERTLRHNLRERGISWMGEVLSGDRIARVVIDPNISVRDEGSGRISVQVNPRIHVPTLLLGVLGPFVSETSSSNNSFMMKNDVGVRARSEIAPANIIFIADLSDSSRCPEEGPCNCNTNNRFEPNTGREISCSEEAGPDRKLKFQRMRESFSNFVKIFDPTRDRIALVFYHNFAWVEVGFPANGSARGFNPVALDDAFNRVYETDAEAQAAGRTVGSYYVPKGTTNISDGLLTAFEHAIQTNMIANNERVQYVLLTDGAPTAMRVSNRLGADVLNFSLVWSRPVAGPNGTSIFEAYEGPGHYNTTSQYKSEINRTNAPLIVGPGVPIVHGCHGPTYPNVWSPIDESRAGAAKWCTKNQVNWQYDTVCPNGTNVNRKCKQFTGTNVTTASIATGEFKQMYYHAAIQVAELLRQNRGTIYAVGWGPKSVASATDPYQNLADGMNLKPVFLANLANDYYLFKSENHPEFSFPEYKKYEDRKIKDKASNIRKEAVGSYHNPENAAQLTEALELIARTIKVRLIKPVDNSTS
ncbi:MAG TPA: pilus assembly protein TadG-related protein [Oligoflexia bacterium]|nr:pilus assembly protein TadG-related protein [Oligoflexia bacterium]HMP48654.1 pilus assembly protein TadG-related protein [Oligoflexia bacterium]